MGNFGGESNIAPRHDEPPQDPIERKEERGEEEAGREKLGEGDAECQR